MTTPKLAAWAAGGIVLLGGVAILAVFLASGDRGAAPGSSTGDAAPDPAAVRPGLPPPSVALPAGPAAQVPQGTVVLGPPAPTPPPGSWEAVPPAARAASMGEVGPALGRELNELQPRLANCFDEDVQARHGTSPITRVQDYAPSEDQGTTILMLQVETQSGSARIVDAPVETRGRASDGLIACAQRVLRGQQVAVPGVEPGKRYRLLYTLLP
jgi:hypothetical protein